MRRDLLALLREEALPVGDIAERLPISRPAVSKHLRVLESAGLVEYTSKGTSNIFRLRSDGFAAVRTYLGSFWDEALSNFQQVTEDTQVAQVDQVDQVDQVAGVQSVLEP